MGHAVNIKSKTLRRVYEDDRKRQKESDGESDEIPSKERAN
jgi:hypothetical protein